MSQEKFVQFDWACTNLIKICFANFTALWLNWKDIIWCSIFAAYRKLTKLYLKFSSIRTERQVLVSTDSVKLQVVDQYCIRTTLIMPYFRIVKPWAQFLLLVCSRFVTKEIGEACLEWHAYRTLQWKHKHKKTRVFSQSLLVRQWKKIWYRPKIPVMAFPFCPLNKISEWIYGTFLVGIRNMQ